MPAASPAPEPSTDSPSLPAARRTGATEKTRFTAGAPDLLPALVEAERFSMAATITAARFTRRSSPPSTR